MDTQIADRYFWPKVEKLDGCWQWKGSQLNGFARMWNGQKTEMAARYSFKLHKGDPGKYPIHPSCGNYMCVNPEHLSAGLCDDVNKNRTEKRFWRYVNKTEFCWLWTGAINGSNSYGYLWDGTRGLRAHRYSYEIHKGEIPEGMLVCHTCDTPLCVNPAHLFLGTVKTNAEDMVAKGRQCRGDNQWQRKYPERRKFGDENISRKRPEVLKRGVDNPNAVLNPEKVRLIRRLASENISQDMIAIQVGCQQTTVSNVLLGRTWKHVE